MMMLTLLFLFVWATIAALALCMAGEPLILCPLG
jgi:hypothetical protein